MSEVRREEPRALLFLCGTKADLLAPSEPPPEALLGLSVSVEKAGGHLPDSGNPGSLRAADAAGQSQQQEVLRLPSGAVVEPGSMDKLEGGGALSGPAPAMEHVPGEDPALQDGAAAQQGLDKQQQQQGQASARHVPEQLQVEDRQAEAVLAAQGDPSAQPDRRSLEAPATPAKAEERQSPSDPAAPQQPVAGRPSPPTLPAETQEPHRDLQQVEHEQAAAAAVPALPEGPLWSPFAAVDRGPASPAVAAVTGGRLRRRSFGSSRSPAPLAVSFVTSQDEWDALSMGSRQHPHSGHSKSSQHGVSFAATPTAGSSFSPSRQSVRRQSGSEAEDEGEGEGAGAAVAQLQQAAVPQAAVSEYCRSQGLTVFWASARTGELQGGSCLPAALWGSGAPIPPRSLRCPPRDASLQATMSRLSFKPWSKQWSMRTGSRESGQHTGEVAASLPSCSRGRAGSAGRRKQFLAPRRALLPGSQRSGQPSGQPLPTAAALHLPGPRHLPGPA